MDPDAHVRFSQGGTHEMGFQYAELPVTASEVMTYGEMCVLLLSTDYRYLGGAVV